MNCSLALDTLEKRLTLLSPLVEKLRTCNGLAKKNDVLKAALQSLGFSAPSWLLPFLEEPSECACVIRSVIALGQGDVVFAFSSCDEGERKRLFQELLDKLLHVERFYAEIGGIVGYHALTLQLLFSGAAKGGRAEASYYPPEGIDISKETADVRRFVFQGIEELAKVAEIYPVGGAADRLRLHDEKTGMELPAAKLRFLGKTLLEGMIADLQAREYLHYKIFGKQLVAPIALMTSLEKDNHAQIVSICEEMNWFGRPKESFCLFSQPSVPTINQEGMWCMQGPLQPLLKPGGHGVIWKLARDAGVFKWLSAQGRKKALLRQINNPIAGIDYGLLAFAGIGCAEDKSFGFASCPRQVKAMEGVNVLIEKKDEDGYAYLLTNIEYCDFGKYNIADEPASHIQTERSTVPYSKFPSNTNILFADLEAIHEALESCPVPGMLVNLKPICYRTSDGTLKEEALVRLESTMQNIADVFIEKREVSLEAGKRGALKTFLTSHVRSKTISTVKREYAAGSSLLETPEGCFLDMMANARELLEERCGIALPAQEALFPLESFIFLYHPSLGPLYAIIAQKVRGGRFARGAELQLEIAEVDIEHLDLSGSMRVTASHLMGHREKGILTYSQRAGKCQLKNVSVRNLGIDREAHNIFWKNEISRKECFTLLIHEDGEFVAQDVVFEGNWNIEVSPGVRLRAVYEEGRVVLRKEPLSGWSWSYTTTPDGEIVLTKKE